MIHSVCSCAPNGGSVEKTLLITNVPAQQTRSATEVTLSVWHALILRESLSRLFSRRGAWAWLLLEPMFHIGFMAFVFTVIRVRTVGGIDTVLWLILGFMGFFLFRRTGNQGANALKANQSLLVYRQVKPVDTVGVRCLLEGLFMMVLMAFALAACALMGLPWWPDEPLTVMGGLLGLWCLGLGFALVVSVAQQLVDELGNLVDMAMLPMYLLSGVIFPLSAVPYPYREWLMVNPVAHALELLRSGFSSYYHATPETDMSYLLACALVLLWLGLALHVRFQKKLVTQ